MLHACQITVTPTWSLLKSTPYQMECSGGNSIVIATITIKNRTKDRYFLSSLKLHWQGQPLNELNGSVYVHVVDQRYLPLEKYHIADGHWDTKSQTLYFDCLTPYKLDPYIQFFIVINADQATEPLIQNGSFESKIQLVDESNISTLQSTSPLSFQQFLP